jgi:hypothetical protein
MFSANLKDKLYQLSGDVAPDMGEGGDDAECVAESVMGVMDAYYKDAGDELLLCVQVHGYDAVLKEAAKHVGTL